MKTHSILFFLLLYFILSNSLFAQGYKDCATALTICDGSTMHFDYSAGIGETDPDIDLTCLVYELNSTWLTWSIHQEGNLTFVLTPDTTNVDIDFLVYKLESQNTCENKVLIRCMASGANFGQPPEYWVNCTGPTGLLIGDPDIEEKAGCQGDDNNFLAPIVCNPGDTYVLLVNIFGGAAGFTLSFGGDAIIDCLPVHTSESDANNPHAFDVVPSPSTGLFYLKLPDEELLGAQLTIYNMAGQVIYREASIDNFKNPINLANSPDGLYVACLRKGEITSTARILLVK